MRGAAAKGLAQKSRDTGWVTHKRTTGEGHTDLQHVGLSSHASMLLPRTTNDKVRNTCCTKSLVSRALRSTWPCGQAKETRCHSHAVSLARISGSSYPGGRFVSVTFLDPTHPIGDAILEGTCWQRAAAGPKAG